MDRGGRTNRWPARPALAAACNPDGVPNRQVARLDAVVQAVAEVREMNGEGIGARGTRPRRAALKLLALVDQQDQRVCVSEGGVRRQRRQPHVLELAVEQVPRGQCFQLPFRRRAWLRRRLRACTVPLLPLGVDSGKACSGQVGSTPASAVPVAVIMHCK